MQPVFCPRSPHHGRVQQSKISFWMSAFNLCVYVAFYLTRLWHKEVHIRVHVYVLRGKSNFQIYFLRHTYPRINQTVEAKRSVLIHTYIVYVGSAKRIYEYSSSPRR